MAWPEILSFIAALATLNGFFWNWRKNPCKGRNDISEHEYWAYFNWISHSLFNTRRKSST